MSTAYRYIVAGLITAVTLFLVWYFSNIVVYILVSAVLAILGKPLVDFLKRIRIGHSGWTMPKWLAALLALITIWVIVLGLFSIFVPIISQALQEFSSLDINVILNSFREPLQSIERFIERTFSIRDENFSMVDAISAQLSSFINISAINNVLTSVVTTVGKTFIAAFSISFITFFFLKENNLFQDMVVIMFPKKYEANITRALDSITQLLIRYFTGIVAESGIMLLIVSIGLLICGFGWQTALLIGLIVGILNVIPYLGPIIGIAVGMLIGLIGNAPDVGTFAILLRIAVTVLSAQAIDNFILQPLLYSNRAKAHPLEIFLVILIAGSLAGVLGMLLAIPAYNVIRVFAKEFFNNFRVVQKLTEKI